MTWGVQRGLGGGGKVFETITERPKQTSPGRERGGVVNGRERSNTSFQNGGCCQERKGEGSETKIRRKRHGRGKVRGKEGGKVLKRMLVPATVIEQTPGGRTNEK